MAAANSSSITLHNVTDTLAKDDEHYVNALLTAADAFRDVEAIFTQPGFDANEGWKLETKNAEDVVYSRETSDGKMYLTKSEMPLAVHSLMDDIWTKFEGAPEWNTNMSFVKTIATLSPNLDICLSGNKEFLAIAAREFLSVRIYRQIDKNTYISAMRSIELDSVPCQEGKVRGWVHISGSRHRAHPNDPCKTISETFAVVDFKGLIPKFIINTVKYEITLTALKVMGKGLLVDRELTRRHFKELSEKTKQNAGH